MLSDFEKIHGTMNHLLKNDVSVTIKKSIKWVQTINLRVKTYIQYSPYFNSLVTMCFLFVNFASYSNKNGFSAPSSLNVTRSSCVFLSHNQYWQWHISFIYPLKLYFNPNCSVHIQFLDPYIQETWSQAWFRFFVTRSSYAYITRKCYNL